MAIRRINSTGRLRIVRDDVTVNLRRDQAGALSFSATVDLNGYKLPGAALVFIEAQRQTTFMRFPFGTVAQPRPTGSTALSEFVSADALQFRVKVTSESEERG